MRDRHRRELRLDQQRKRRRVADEGAERPDIDEGHDPGMLAPDDGDLVPERRLGRGEVVHEENRAEHRDGQRQDPHQAGVLEVDARDRRRLIEVDQADPHQDGRQQLHAADADIAAGRVEAERPALHAVGIEERDVGHAGGKIAAAETGRGGHQQHQPERGSRARRRNRRARGRDEQHRGAEDGPVAAPECGHGEGVGKPHQRADQPGYRHQLKQLIGRVVEAGLRQFGRDDAPDQPDRKPDMLGNDRPDQIAPGDNLAGRIPERLIFGLPFRNPGRVLLAHRRFPFCVSIVRPGSSRPHPKGMEARHRESPIRRMPQIRMIGFDGRLRWRRH